MSLEAGILDEREVREKTAPRGHPVTSDMDTGHWKSMGALSGVLAKV